MGKNPIMFQGKSRTQTHFERDNDPRAIMRRFNPNYEKRTPQGATEPKYMDFRTFKDYHDMQNKVLKAQRRFEALPAKIKKECDNDPGKFITMVNEIQEGNEETIARAIEIGLLPETSSKAHRDAVKARKEKKEQDEAKFVEAVETIAKSTKKEKKE
jgi:hypothetical protein